MVGFFFTCQVGHPKISCFEKIDPKSFQDLKSSPAVLFIFKFILMKHLEQLTREIFYWICTFFALIINYSLVKETLNLNVYLKNGNKCGLAKLSKYTMDFV